MKNIYVYLILLISIVSYSQEKVNINAIINRPVEIDVPKSTVQKQDYNNFKSYNRPIYMPPQYNIEAANRLLNEFEFRIINDRVRPRSELSLDLTPIKIDIHENTDKK